MNVIEEMIIQDAKLSKKLFDLCVKNEGEGVLFHIVNQSKFEEEQEYRVYHKDGYCFDVKKSKVDIAEDEICVGEIHGFEYEFYSEWEGFKELEVEDAINLFK